MNRQQILNQIMTKYTGIDFEKNRSLMSENLFGHKIGIEPRTMLEIYVELKKKCDQESLSRAVISGNFRTYNDLLKVIE